VKGWQFSANGQNQNPDWIALDPGIDKWGVGAVRFFKVNNSVIDHNAANNCTSISFSLFASSSNTVSNNTADYPFTMNFIVADGSSFNKVTGNIASTGDFIGYMIADPLAGETLTKYGSSHDNTLAGNISHTDGPTGTEIKGSVVPAFLGGYVVLNGSYNNTIQGNQDWASTGDGLVWAQAVLDSTTPIGVVAYPPALHCNVTDYNGPLPTAPALNGNKWTGNTSAKTDSCIPPQ
jgi:parallel beta-helix repeat protein